MTEYVKTIPEILYSMGYREMEKNVFGKPIAYSIFIVVLKENEIVWSNRFKNNEEFYVWDTDIISKEDFTIDFIKDCENETNISFHDNCNTSFEFGIYFGL